MRLVERYRLLRGKAEQVGKEAMLAGTKTALGLPSVTSPRRVEGEQNTWNEFTRIENTSWSAGSSCE